VDAMRERTWMRVAAVLTVLVFGATAAACGGGGDDVQVSGASGSEEPIGGEPITDEVDEMRDQLEDVAGGEMADCVAVGLAYMTLTLGVGFGSLGAAMGADTEQMQATADELSDLQEDIPEDIREDFETIRTAYEDMIAELDLPEGETPNLLDPEFQEKLDDASALLESPEVEDAQANIEAYMQDQCPDAASSFGS